MGPGGGRSCGCGRAKLLFMSYLSRPRTMSFDGPIRSSHPSPLRLFPPEEFGGSERRMPAWRRMAGPLGALAGIVTIVTLVALGLRQPDSAAYPDGDSAWQPAQPRPETRLPVVAAPPVDSSIGHVRIITHDDDARVKIDGVTYLSGLGTEWPLPVKGDQEHAIAMQVRGRPAWQSTVFVPAGSTVVLEPPIKRVETNEPTGPSPRPTGRPARAAVTREPTPSKTGRAVEPAPAAETDDAGTQIPESLLATRDSLRLLVQQAVVLGQIGRYVDAADALQGVLARVAELASRKGESPELGSLRAEAERALQDARQACRQVNGEASRACP